MVEPIVRADPPRVIEVYWDARATSSRCRFGAYRACLIGPSGGPFDIHDCGSTRAEAIREVLITAASRGLSGRVEDYEVRNL